MKAVRSWKFIAAVTVLALALSACGTKNAEKNQTLAGGGGASGQTSGSQTSTQGQAGGAASGGQQTGAQSQQPANNNAQSQSKSWTTPPAMQIDANKTYQATVTTSKGTFKIDLFAKDAPKTVNNFVFLSKEGFYNNVVFHRIIKTFMVQTGDPTGTGRGGPGYKFEDELKTTTHKYEPGIVAMANAGPNTNGSQFFICTGDDSKNLNQMPNYTIFGKVVEGMDVVQKIAETPVDPSGEGSTPKEKVTIQSVSIAEK
ncbi:peptidylprolyl isomerase [Paenibacillus thalictri]|uniref:Peptidyl-prolyl cis-trans isomerase n=1 Tax=Paenibacillus thalictri TaxID=2527873 RepID=A0A4Q9DV96_9BACL|nr:peptidylprolyl isomerase [Paenibacillus thalictri]TBL80194.1 peptidylprolyl isomerase [Paenibacillus thalictri]